MENRRRIGIFLLIIGIFLFVSSYTVSYESNTPAENMTKLILFGISVILIITGIILVVIKEKTNEIPIKQTREVQKDLYCQTCGAKVLDDIGDFCSKCGAKIK